MYISNRFNLDVFTPTNDDCRFEVLWVRVTHPDMRSIYYFTAVYHPPRTHLCTDLELIKFLKVTVKLIESTDKIAAFVISGDFNQIPTNSIENLVY
jgi:hypothetical protein